MTACRWLTHSGHFMLLTTGLCLSGLVCAADDQLPEHDPNALEAIEIQGQESGYRTGDIIAEDQSLSRSHITREALTKGPPALAEILARESGVQYRQSGGFGSYSAVSIRAASAARTGIYVDGILLNSGGNPIVDLSTLEILNLESVDIYRGSTPLQLGHSTIGGAVNLNTLAVGNTPHTRVRLGAGSHGQGDVQLSHQNSVRQWTMLGAVSHRQSDNDFKFTRDNGTPLNTQDDTVLRRGNSQARRASALLGVGYRHLQGTTNVTVQLAERSQGVPDWLNSQDNQANYQTESSQMQLSHVQDGIGNWNTRHSLYWHSHDARFFNPVGRIDLIAQDTFDDTDTLGARTYWEYPGAAGVFATSLDFRQESINSRDRLDPLAHYDANRDEWLATAHYVWYSPEETWSVTPALRTQRSDQSVNRSRPAAHLPTRTQSARTTAELGLSYKLNPQVDLSLNLGSYFRTPSFGELYGAIGLIRGNPLLAPEKGINSDFSIRYKTPSLALTGSLFSSDSEELIVTSFNARGVGRPVNSGQAQIRGAELASSWTPNKAWELSSNLTWQSAKSVDRESGFYNKFLPGEARFSWFAKVQFNHSRWSYWYELDYQRDRYYDRANILPAKDTRQHSLGLQWRSKRWQAIAGIHNLTDRNVEDFNGFPKPGRTWSLSVSRSL